MTGYGIMSLSVLGAMGAALNGAVDSPVARDSALITFGNELSEALGFGRLFGVVIRVALIWLCLRLFEALIPRVTRWRLTLGHSLRAWAPTVRLTVTGLILLIVIDALTPDEAGARAIVAGGLIVAVLWSSQAVLRNAAAGAFIIARRAVTVGEQLRVGEIAGRVVSVNLRGVELQTPDGSRAFIPGVQLHTEARSHAPRGVRAAAVHFAWPIPDESDKGGAEELRHLVKRLALLSTRRAPGTPVLVQRSPDTAELWITLTPYDRAEGDALRLEVTRRLRDAFAPPAPGEDPEAEGDTAGA